MVNPWLGICLVISLFIGLVASLQAYCRYFSPHPEWVRKALHVAMGLVALISPWLFKTAWPVMLLVSIFTVVLIALRISPFLKHIFGGLFDGIGRYTLGEIYFPLGAGLAFLLSAGEEILFFIPMLILALADPAAALVGKRYGQLRYVILGGEKSVEGSLAFLAVTFLSTYIPLLLLTHIGHAEILLLSLTLALLATLLEALGGYGLDNLFVPLGTLLCLKILLNLDEIRLTILLGLTGILVLIGGFGVSAGILQNARAIPPSEKDKSMETA